MKKFGMLFLVVGLMLSVTSCKKSVFTWDLVIENNTADQLTIFERTGAGNYHEVGAVMPNSTTKERGYVMELDYTFEARKSDGTVVAAFSHNEKEFKHKEITWTIN